MLVEPGDVCLFSGAQAHCAVCVGDKGLSLTAYESFVNLHPTHTKVFTRTNNPEFHFEECHAEDGDLKDIKMDVADQMHIAVEKIEDGHVQDYNAIGHVRKALDVLRQNDSFLDEQLPQPPDADKASSPADTNTAGQTAATRAATGV